MGNARNLADGEYIGDLTVDTNTFHVDATDNRVGIGTSTPLKKFHLADAGDTHMALQSTNAADNSEMFEIGVGANAANKVDLTFRTRLNNGSGGAEHMRITNDGHVTTPSQPAFGVYKTSSTGSGSDVTHDGSYSNVGNHYNSSTGRFTCPVAGTYYFYCTGLTQNAGNITRISLRANGSKKASESRNENISGVYLHIVTVGVMTLSANDYVTMYYANDDGGTNLYSDTSPYISFGGYLIG